MIVNGFKKGDRIVSRRSDASRFGVIQSISKRGAWVKRFHMKSGEPLPEKELHLIRSKSLSKYLHYNGPARAKTKVKGPQSSLSLALSKLKELEDKRAALQLEYDAVVKEIKQLI